MKKLNITAKLTEWLNKNNSKSLEGKYFFTRYDVLKSISETENLEYRKLEKIVNKNEEINNYLNDWLNNNFWHVMISLKIPKGIELYIETELKLKYKKHVPNFVNDIPTPKIKVPKFTMNNPIDGFPNFVNKNDEIMNLGKLQDFEEFEIPLEEEMEPDHD